MSLKATTPEQGAANSEHESDGLLQSLNAALEAVRRAPHSDEAWNHVEELADALQRPDEVADTYVELMRGQLAAEQRDAVAKRSVAFHDTWFGDDAGAMDTLLAEIVERMPEAAWAFERLVVLRTSGEQWDELLDLYDRALERTGEAQDRVRLLHDAAQVAKDFAHQPERAADYMQMQLEIEPDNEKLAASIDRLLERQKRWSDLIAFLHRRIEQLPALAARQTRVRVARIYIDHLQQAEPALEELETLVAEAPGHDEGSIELERLLDWHDAPLPVRMRALALLRTGYEASDRPSDLVAVVERAVAFAAPDVALELRREAGGRLAVLNRPADAIRHYAALLERRPDDTDARRQLRQLGAQAGLQRAQAEALERAARAAEPALRASLWLEAADLHRENLADPDVAVDLYRAILELPEADQQTALVAAHHLNELLAAAKRLPERLDILERLAELEQASVVRRALLREAGRLADDLGEADRALAAYERCLAAAPDDLTTLDAIVNVLAKYERWAPLVDALRRRAQSDVTPQQRRADLVRIARLQSDELAAPAEAIATWLEVRQEFGDESQTIAALDQLLAQVSRWDELAPILDRASRFRRAEATALLARLGEVFHTQLGEPARAALLYAHTLGVDATDDRARAGLRDLLDFKDAVPTATTALVQAYRATEDWALLVELIEPRLACAPSARLKVDILRETAELERKHLGDAAAAQRSLARALLIDPEDLALDHELEQLADRTGDHALLAGTYAEAADRSASPLRTAQLKRKEGRVREVALGDVSGALAAYEVAAELDPGMLATQRSLLRAACGAGDWERATRAFLVVCGAREQLDIEAAAEFTTAADGEEAWTSILATLQIALRGADLPSATMRDLWARCAHWYRDHLGDAEAAETAAREALRFDSQHLATLMLLAELRRPSGDRRFIDTLLRIDELMPQDLDALVEAQATAMGLDEDPTWLRDVTKRLYDKATRVLGRNEAVQGEHRGEPTARRALATLVDLDCRNGERRGAINLLLEASELPFSRDAQLDLKLQAARLCVEEGEPDRAIELMWRVSEERRNDLALVVELGVLCERHDRLVELIAVRGRELELVDDAERTLALRLEIAGLVGRLERRDGRVQVLRRNLAERPGHHDTLEALAELLLDKGRFDELADLLCEQASRVEQSEPRWSANLWSRAARLVEERFADLPRAITALEHVVALVPTVEALDDLARLHAQGGDFARAASVLSQRLELTDEAQRVPVRVRLARAHISADQEDAAIAALEVAFQDAPRNAEVRRLLFGLYRKYERWEPLAEALTLAAQHLTDGTTVLAYAGEASQILDERLGAAERAVPVLQRAFELVPDDRLIRMRLAESLRLAKRYDEAREILAALVAEYGRRRSQERASVHLQLAQVARGQGDLQGALDELEQAAGMDGSNPTITRNLAELAREIGAIDRAERAYRTLLLQLKRGSDTEPARGSSSIGNVIGISEVLYELSRIAQERGDAEQAAELVESALGALAQNDDEGRRIQQLLLSRQDFTLLRRVLDARLQSASTPRRRAEVLGGLADLYEHQLGEPQRAFETRIEALLADPASPELHAAAQAAALELGQLERYVETLDELLDTARRTTDAYTRCELLLRQSDLCERHHADLDKAAALLEAAEATGVREVDVWRQGARLAGARGDTATQMRYLERLASLGEQASETRADALFRMAEVRLVDADTVDAGLRLLQEALESTSNWERACQVLAHVELEEPPVELLDLHERVARKARSPEALLLALERRAEHPTARLEDVKEACDLAAQHNEAERARALMLRAVDLSESVLDGKRQVDWALIGLATACLQADDLADAARWFCEAVEVGQPGVLHALGQQIADAAQNSGGDITLAIKVYEAMFEREPTEESVWKPLAQLYRRFGAVDRLVRLVEETLDSLDSSAARNALRVELAKALLEHEDRTPEAIDILRNVLLENPEEAVARDLLVELLERSGDEHEIIDLMRQQLMLAQQQRNGEHIVAASLRLAKRVEAQDRQEAVEVLRSALEWAPEDATLLRTILGFIDPEDGAGRAEFVERLIAAETGDEAARLALELASDYGSRSEEDAELRALVLGYRRAPHHGELRRQLKAAYEVRGDYRGLAQMLEAAAEQATDPAARAEMLRQAAAITRDALSDPHGAATILSRAREEAPVDPELALELASALSAAGKFERATQVLGDQLAQPTDDTDIRLRLLVTRATLRREAGDHEGAAEDFEAALPFGEEEVLPLLLETLEHQLEVAQREERNDQMRAATLRIVDLCAPARPDRARELLGSWLERERKDAGALWRLRDLDAAAARWDEVAKTCARLVAVEHDEAQIEAALALAEAWREYGKPEEARSGLEFARRKQPDEPRLLAELRQIYAQTGADRELARLLAHEASLLPDGDDKTATLRRAAALFISSGEPEAALPLVTSILERNPEDFEATIVLVDAQLTIGQIDAADAALEAALAAVKQKRSPEAAQLYHRKAKVAGTRGDAEGQLELLQQAFSADKNNGDVAAELADLAEAHESWDLAVRVLRTITLLETPCPITRVQAFLRQAQICARRGDRQRAVLWARKAQHEDPEDLQVANFMKELEEA